MIGRELADYLVEVGHGIGVHDAHHMLSPSRAEEAGEPVLASIGHLAQALEDAGEPHAAAAIRSRLSRSTGERLPILEADPLELALPTRPEARAVRSPTA
jgi:hypothetical protein